MFLPLTAALLLAAPADAPQDGKVYTVKAVHSGKALAPAADGGGVEQCEPKTDAVQHWKFVKSGDHFRVVHVKTGKAVEVPAEAEDATPLTLSAGKGGDRQLWKVAKQDKGFTLTSKATGKVWDINEASGDDGAKLIQYPLKDGDEGNQRFELELVEGK